MVYQNVLWQNICPNMKDPFENVLWSPKRLSNLSAVFTTFMLAFN